MPSARPDICAFPTPHRSIASTKACAVSIASSRGSRPLLNLKPAPQRLEPIFSPRIWGARSLAPLFPEKTNLAEPLGEAWLTGVDCMIATGPFAGRTLGAAWLAMPAGWRGTRLRSVADFPLLLKFIFPTDKLSIQ